MGCKDRRYREDKIVPPLHGISAPSTGRCWLVTFPRGRNILADPGCSSAAGADCVFFV